jgi:hypothetical protein
MSVLNTVVKSLIYKSMKIINVSKMYLKFCTKYKFIIIIASFNVTTVCPEKSSAIPTKKLVREVFCSGYPV